MPECLFATDLHGKKNRYELLFDYIREKPADILLLGGDLLPPFMPRPDSSGPARESFLDDILVRGFSGLKELLGARYPEVFLIMGNDDPRFFESSLISSGKGLWTFINQRRCVSHGFQIFGYGFVPPTPFQLKDWERFDVSRYVDIGCTPPDSGYRTIPASDHDINWRTISEDLEKLTSAYDLTDSIFLFHAPPYDTGLDLGDTGGRMVDHVPIDEHMGSIAVKRFIEEKQPLVSLHGHIHESSRLSGRWLEKIGKTVCINGAHDGPELSVVRFSPEKAEDAERILI